MKKAIRAKYASEFKHEAVRMAEAKGSIAGVARDLGVPEQTLFNWVKAAREGRLPTVGTGRAVSAEQMELARLRVELSQARMEVEILKKAAAYFAKAAL